MKRRALFLAALAAAGMLLTTACTSSDREIAQDAGSGTSGIAGTAVPDAQGNADGAGTQEQAGQDSNTDDSAQEQPDAAGQSDATGQTDSPSQSETRTPAVGQTETSTDGSGESPVAQDIWSGTYVGDQDTVTIALVDEKTLSFSFANAGIASTAEIDGLQAVYKGDDHHDVVFEMIEGVLNITVLSEEDFDASGSPLNGVYVHQVVSSDTE